MAHVSVQPDILTTAAADLDNIGAMLDDAQKAAVPATVQLAPAAADEVSAGIAQLFEQHAQDYHAAAQQATAYGEEFVQLLITSAASYDSVEDLNALLFNGLYAAMVFPSAALFLGALAYANWLYPYLAFLPEELVYLAYLPATFMMGGAVGNGLFWLFVQAALSSLLQSL